MIKGDVIAELERRIADLKTGKKSISKTERIDELRVFKLWVERQ